jgi:ABC-2 type transport system ATP-binding protein
MLEFRGITKKYTWRQRPAIQDVTLSVSPGEVLGLVGLNGAGKTTSLRVACGVALATNGDVEVDGFSILRRKAEASRLIGWVPEQPVHDGSVRVASLVHYYSDIAGGVLPARGRELLREWGMEEFGRKRFRELSLGYKRRLAVVVASLTGPRYFLLDEPFNGLDPVAMVQFRKWIMSAKHDGRGIILSSHVLREVQALCDRIAVIHHGRIISTMTADELASSVHKEVTVVLDREDAGARVLLERFGAVTLSGNTVTIRGVEIDPGAVNASLVKAGYVVQRLTTGESDLEEYFLRVVGETS